MRTWLRIFFPVVLQIRAHGRKNVPSEGAVIITANHQSFLDPTLVGTCLNRPVHYMARKSLFVRFRPFGWLISALHAFPVDREGGNLSAVRETLRRLKSGAVVLGFPEGTRTQGGEMGDFKAGIFMIAVRSGAPVVPAAIAGARDAWPRNAILPRPAVVHVAFGRPLYARDFGNDADKLMRECRRSVAALYERVEAGRRRR